MWDTERAKNIIQEQVTELWLPWTTIQPGGSRAEYARRSIGEALTRNGLTLSGNGWVLVVCGDEMISKKLFQYVIK